MDNLFIFSIFIIFILFWFYKKPQTASAPDPAQPQHTSSETKTSPYRGISIQHRTNACKAVKNIGGKRYLADVAPTLPIVGCSSKKCKCNYQQLEDRRTGEDRRFPSADFQGIYSAEEHRKRKDRRQFTPNYAYSS